MNDSLVKMRRSQFTLRAALVLFLVVAAFLAGRVSIESELRESQANEGAARLRIRVLAAAVTIAENRAEVADVRAQDAERKALSLPEIVAKLRRASLDRNELLNAGTYQELYEAYLRHGIPPPRIGVPINTGDVIRQAPESDDR